MLSLNPTALGLDFVVACCFMLAVFSSIETPFLRSLSWLLGLSLLNQLPLTQLNTCEVFLHERLRFGRTSSVQLMMCRVTVYKSLLVLCRWTHHSEVLFSWPGSKRKEKELPCALQGGIPKDWKPSLSSAKGFAALQYLICGDQDFKIRIFDSIYFYVFNV